MAVGRTAFVLTTFDGVEAAGAQKVTLHLENHDNNTLTNPVVTLTWADPDLTVTWANPKPPNARRDRADHVHDRERAGTRLRDRVPTRRTLSQR